MPEKRDLSIVGVLATAALVLLAIAGAGYGQEEPDTESLSEPEAKLYATAGEVRFANDRDARDIPFELNSDKIYMQVRLNGKGPFWMILDTGSPGMVLDTATAEKLGLEEGATGATTGAGEGSFPLTAVEGGVDVGLPGVDLLQQTAAIGPLDSIVGPYEGRRLEGILGCYNLLTRARVEIDYADQKVHIEPFREDTATEGALVVPINSQYGHPMTEGKLLPKEGEAVPGTFLIDTGMRGSLLLPAPYVDANSLIERSGKTVYTTSGGGIGGQVFTHLGRLRSLSFGDVTIEDLPVNMSQATEGLLSEEWNGGIIGSDVLQRFRVVFDYAHDRLVLFPRTFDADDLGGDKSGLFLVSEIEDRAVVRVLHVVEGSPGALAGVRVGDLVRAVDGRSAEDLGLEEVRGRLRAPADTNVTLSLDRAGEPLEARLTLRPLV